MLKTTIGQLLVNEALPDDLRDYGRVLDKKGISELLGQVAERYPDRYREISHKLMTIGRESAYRTGGMSFGVKHLRVPPAALKVRQGIEKQVEQILESQPDSPERDQAVIQVLREGQKTLAAAVYEAAKADDNPLAKQVLSGARGNPTQLNRLLGGDLLYVDQHDNEIPVPVTHSYSEGLLPVEWFAGSFGGRKGIIDVKMCVSATTSVLMADYSVKQIQEIKPGDWVMGADKARKLLPVRVRAVYDNGLRPCCRFTFRSGKKRFAEVVATKDHRLLATFQMGRGQYQHRTINEPTLLPLSAITPGALRAKAKFVAQTGAGELDPSGERQPLALFLGLMLGDGCTLGVNQFSCADPLLLADIQDYLTAWNLELRKQADTGCCYTLAEIVPSKRRKDERNDKFIAASANAAKQYLYDAGARNKYAYAKQLPEAVWAWDHASICQLLGGLYATDGGISRRKAGNGYQVFFDSTSYALIRDVQRLLEFKLGIRTGHIVPRKQDVRVCYRVSVCFNSEIQKFASMVPLYGIKRHRLAKALAELEQLSVQKQPGFRPYQIEDVGEQPTFDIEVDHPDHMFVLANGLISENSTANSGWLAKQLAQAAHRLMVTERDADEPGLGSPLRGLPVSIDDKDNEGALLARETAGYPRNTPLTPKILGDLRSKGVQHLLVRSPLVGGPRSGGVYAQDVGVRERGGLPGAGDMVGIAAAQALSEKLTQGALGSKHSGGVAGAAASVSGFPLINQFVQVPEVFPGGAVHSQLDGIVSRIEPAAAGGYDVYVDNEKHYVGPGYELKVKPKQEVEAGDVLTNGIPSPAEVVWHKGVGEGRRYFTDALQKAYQDSGMRAHRRNVELVARGLIDHVRLNEEYGQHFPDDVVSYSQLEHSWQPREGTQRVNLSSARGKYLERPVLHYSIGTKVRPSVVKQLQQFGVGEVDVHESPPPFQPEMIPGRYNLLNDPDWLTRMYGSNLSKGLLQSVHRGATSDSAGTSFVPSLAEGTSFGKTWPAPPKPAMPQPTLPKPPGSLL